jgi:adenylate cyclase class 2
MLEVEVKYRAADRDTVLAKLLALGAELASKHTEADTYLNAPDRDFKQTDEAFRIRFTGNETWLTYKGPKRDPATKTRKEIQVRVSDRGDLTAELSPLFVALGYRPVAVVRKQRAVYHLDRPVGPKPRLVEVCFDDVERVGPFVEIEILAEEAEFEAAKAAALGLAAELGLTDQERRSYLQMLLEAQGPGQPRA